MQEGIKSGLTKKKLGGPCSEDPWLTLLGMWLVFLKKEK